MTMTRKTVFAGIKLAGNISSPTRINVGQAEKTKLCSGFAIAW
jgi:hypothetical protein